MASYTYNPTSNTTPDPGAPGSLAVSGASNTGHTNTTCTASGGTNSQSKSCRWTAFPAKAGEIKSITLKVDWSRSGTTSDRFIDTSNRFVIDYSLNNGSSFSNLRDDNDFTSSNNGTDSVALSVTQDLTQV